MGERFEKIISCIEKEKQPHVMLLGIMMIIFVGIADFQTGYTVGFSLFYLIPIFIITWGTTYVWGMLASFLSAISWTFAHYLSGLVYESAFGPFWNICVRMLYFIIVVVTIDQLKKALLRERNLAQYDALTGICNSACFRERAHSEMAKALRHNRTLTLAYIDCDNFKTVNDTLGHRQGDILLVLIADTLKQNIRSIDIAGRLGGDEFVILLPETEMEGAKVLMNRLHHILSKGVQEVSPSVTFSIGVAIFHTMPVSLDEMIHQADQLMYTAKKSGKNTIRYKECPIGREIES